MMKLYWAPRTRSRTALWLMEETGKPYERVLIDLSKGAQSEASYRAINPMAKVPALQDGDATIGGSCGDFALYVWRWSDTPTAILHLRSEMSGARNISTGCFFFCARLASSPPWCRSRPSCADESSLQPAGAKQAVSLTSWTTR